MNTRWIGMIAGVLTAVLTQAVGLRSATADKTAQGSCEQYVSILPPGGTLDIGKQGCFAITNFSYVISNRTDNAIPVHRVSALCPCSEVWCTTNLLAPHATAQICVKLDNSKILTERFTRTFFARFRNIPGRLTFTYFGTTTPAYKGVPDGEIQLRAETVPVQWTNHFEIVMLKSDLELGKVVTGGSLAIESSLKEGKTADGQTTLVIDTVVKKNEVGSGTGFLQIPFPNYPWVPGIKINFRGSAGRFVQARPSEFLVDADEDEIGRSFTIRGIDDFDPQKLTWKPQGVEGLTVTERMVRRGKSEFFKVRMDLTRAAYETVITNEFHGLEFSYPGYGPAIIKFRNSDEVED
ncbi:MAG: hypothetical protein IKR48_10315 [Kiritimatiellae bacterium]|nr:hypothetical protein [Kiritimatiellia bacterium]